MNVKTQPLAGRQKTSSALSSNLQANPGPATLLSLLGYNSGPDQFIQIHDAPATPAEGSAPLFTFRVLAGQNFSLDVPVDCLAGIFVCNSATLATKTLGAADTWFVTRHI